MSKESNQQTTSHDAGSSPEIKWPSVPFAYDFVLPSYQWMLSRLEAIDGRIQGILTFAATFTLGMPLIGKSIIKDISFTSRYFLGALGVFSIIVAYSVVRLSWGHLQLANPGVIHQKWLHLSAHAFKLRALYWASRHFNENTILVNTKGRAVNWLSGLLCLEVGLLLLWIITAS